MITFDKKIEVVTKEIVEVVDGEYFFKRTDYDGLHTFRRYIINGDVISELVVVNLESYKRILWEDEIYFNLNYIGEECFGGNERVTIITKEEFSQEYKEALKYLSNIN
jgi:hypothetical protein